MVRYLCGVMDTISLGIDSCWKSGRHSQQVGIKAEDYSGHSFRIRAATTVAEKGVQDSLIQTLGRWQSSAYILYIKTPQQVLCNVARTLVQD